MTWDVDVNQSTVDVFPISYYVVALMMESYKKWFEPCGTLILPGIRES
jgi:hypothetical protein